MAKTILITGVSSGIGRAAAELLSSRGWRVAGTSRDPGPLRAWSGEHGVALFQLDVTDDRSIEACVAGVCERCGGIDVLVNNAGYGLFGPLEGATRAEVEEQFRTNVLGPIALVQRVLPVMRRQKGGTIVNVSSLGGRTAAPFASLYHASKFAIEGFSESLRYETSLHGIRVKLIEPSHHKTGFISRSLHVTSHADYDKYFGNYMEWVHEEDRKAPGPEAVAEAILKAAEDPSPRLRYPVHAAVMLALTRLLPDAVWRPLLAAGMTRRPKQKSAGP